MFFAADGLHGMLAMAAAFFRGNRGSVCANRGWRRDGRRRTRLLLADPAAI